MSQPDDWNDETSADLRGSVLPDADTIPPAGLPVPEPDYSFEALWAVVRRLQADMTEVRSRQHVAINYVQAIAAHFGVELAKDQEPAE